MVKAEMQNPDDAYTVEITPISTTEEAIIITAKTPTDNYGFPSNTATITRSLVARFAVITIVPSVAEIAPDIRQAAADTENYREASILRLPQPDQHNDSRQRDVDRGQSIPGLPQPDQHACQAAAIPEYANPNRRQLDKRNDSRWRDDNRGIRIPKLQQPDKRNDWQRRDDNRGIRIPVLQQLGKRNDWQRGDVDWRGGIQGCAHNMNVLKLGFFDCFKIFPSGSRSISSLAACRNI